MGDVKAWNTTGFVERMHSLNRVNLRDLYPSEAWSIYRIIPQVNNLLDICCGGSNMSQIVRTVNPALNYTGVDLNKELVDEGNKKFGSEKVKFIASDIFRFLESHSTKY